MNFIATPFKIYPMAKYSKKSQKKVERAMHEMKRGRLKSGRSGKKVSNPRQAIAIGLSEARESGAKVPRKGAKKSAPKKSAARKTGAKKSAGRKTGAKKSAARTTRTVRKAARPAKKSAGRPRKTSSATGKKSSGTARKKSGRSAKKSAPAKRGRKRRS